MADWSIPAFDFSGEGYAALPVAEEPFLDYKVASQGGLFLLSFGEAAHFAVSFSERRIELADGSAMDDPASLHHLLYDHVIPRVIAGSGALVLHGSAIEIGGGLALIIGESGAGKSTLSASLHHAGYHLLGDDAVIISEQDGAFLGEAVYASLRLFPDSIAEVLGTGVATAPMAHYSKKRHVTDFRGRETPSGPLPIRQIFFLGDPYHEPCLETVPPGVACMALLEQSFALDPDDIAAARERMAQASRLAAAVSAKALYYPRDFAALPQVHRLIEEAMGGHGHPATASESPA